GVKTGFTTSAGRCLVSAAEKNGTTLICVTLNDKNDWKDHEELLDYGFSKCKSVRLETEIPKRIFTADGLKNTEIRLGEEYLSVCENDKISYKICLPKFLWRGVEKGEQIGRIETYCNNFYVKSVPILAENSIKIGIYDTFSDNLFKNFLMILRSM
ncbi:MAG: hypothetical protein KBS52_00105, partial [Clostridiales bacterium]|nr:hypothetical protein [Candidatus Equinaster intestinalis]